MCICFLLACLCVHFVYGCLRRPSVRSLRGGVRGGYEPAAVGAGKWIHVLRRSCQCSYPLSHLPSPSKLSPLCVCPSALHLTIPSPVRDDRAACILPHGERMLTEAGSHLVPAVTLARPHLMLGKRSQKSQSSGIPEVSAHDLCSHCSLLQTCFCVALCPCTSRVLGLRHCWLETVSSIAHRISTTRKFKQNLFS